MTLHGQQRSEQNEKQGRDQGQLKDQTTRLNNIALANRMTMIENAKWNSQSTVPHTER